MKQKEMNEEEMSEQLNTYDNSYSDDGLFSKLGKFIGKLGEEIIYTVLILFYVLKSPDTSLKTKSIALGALGYFISPIDLIPDFIPIIGMSDDIAIILFAIHAVMKDITPDIKNQAKDQMHEWFDEIDEENLENRW